MELSIQARLYLARLRQTRKRYGREDRKRVWNERSRQAGMVPAGETCYKVLFWFTNFSQFERIASRCYEGCLSGCLSLETGDPVWYKKVTWKRCSTVVKAKVRYGMVEVDYKNG